MDPESLATKGNVRIFGCDETAIEADANFVQTLFEYATSGIIEIF